MKNILLKVRVIAFFIVCLITTKSKAQNKDFVDIQTYIINSFNGQPKKITVAYDYDDRLKISYLKDTLFIYRTYGIKGKAEIINKKFLKITYGYMAGSDLHDDRVVFICVKDNRLCVPLLATSLLSWEITQVYNKVVDSSKLFNEKSICQINFNTTTDDKVMVDIHDENTSKHDPNTNYNHDYHTALFFDGRLNVFYNKYENLAAYYTIFHPDTDVEEKKYIWGNYPVVSLGKSEYYYIKGQWYEKGDNNYLSGYSTTNVKSLE